MVDSTRNIVKQQIVTAYVSGLDQCPTTASMVEPTIAHIRQLKEVILTDYSLYLSRMKNPQEDSKERKDALDALLMQLQEAIDAKNTDKVLEIERLKAFLAT